MAKSKVSAKSRVEIKAAGRSGRIHVIRVGGNGRRRKHADYANTQAARRAAKRDFPGIPIRMQ